MPPIRAALRGAIAACLLAPMLAAAAPAAHAAPANAAPGNAASGNAASGNGASGNAASIVVAPFDFFDTAADQRPKIVADQHRWLKQALIRLRHDLARKPGLDVINSALSRHAIAVTASDYAHPSSCPSCLVADARKAGATYILAPELHRVSDLILYMRVTLYRVGGNQPVFGRISEVKADNRRMIMRATDSMARAVARVLATRQTQRAHD